MPKNPQIEVPEAVLERFHATYREVATHDRLEEALAAALEVLHEELLGEEAISLLANRLEHYGWIVSGDRLDEVRADTRRAAAVALSSVLGGSE